jgi:hypothetical protein
MRSAASPELAVVTSYPASERIISRISRCDFSSSTTSMLLRAIKTVMSDEKGRES